MVVLAGLKGYGKGNVPQDIPSLLALCWHNSHGLSLLRNKVLWLEVPGALNWEVCAGLLGASLILCMGGDQVNKYPPPMVGNHGARAALLGRGVHMPGNRWCHSR